MIGEPRLFIFMQSFPAKVESRCLIRQIWSLLVSEFYADSIASHVPSFCAESTNECFQAAVDSFACKQTYTASLRNIARWWDVHGPTHGCPFTTESSTL